jgi:hypothetical protein
MRRNNTKVAAVPRAKLEEMDGVFRVAGLTGRGVGVE